MSMTVALVLLAAAVLLGLLVHGWWSVRRATPRQARPVEEGARVEPVLGPDGTGADTARAQSPELLPQEAAADVPEPEQPAVRWPAVRRVAALDALVDAVVPISVEAPVSGEIALAHLPATRRAGSKPMLVEGLNAETADWEPPLHGQTYSEFQAGVLLANRNGPLNEIEYSEFVHKVEAFADGVGGMADFPDMLEVVARARELDEFASPLDAQIALTLRANGIAWSVGFVVQSAARHGFVPGVLPGRLVVPGAEEGAPPVLVLGFDPQAALAEDPQNAALREVSLSLDVPQTPEAAEPFPAWYQAATALCADLDAVAVDDQGQPVTLGAFDAIGRQLGQLYRSLEARDLAAGSPAARRLFSG